MMDLVKQLRDASSRATDPKVRDQLKAQADGIEASLVSIANSKARFEATKAGRGPFFTWNTFVLGLGLVGVLVASIYLGLPSWMMVLGFVLVAFVIVSIQLLLVTSRAKKHNDPS